MLELVELEPPLIRHNHEVSSFLNNCYERSSGSVAQDMEEAYQKFKKLEIGNNGEIGQWRVVHGWMDLVRTSQTEGGSRYRQEFRQELFEGEVLGPKTTGYLQTRGHGQHWLDELVPYEIEEGQADKIQRQPQHLACLPPSHQPRLLKEPPSSTTVEVIDDVPMWQQSVCQGFTGNKMTPSRPEDHKLTDMDRMRPDPIRHSLDSFDMRGGCTNSNQDPDSR